MKGIKRKVRKNAGGVVAESRKEEDEDCGETWGRRQSIEKRPSVKTKQDKKERRGEFEGGRGGDKGRRGRKAEKAIIIKRIKMKAMHR
jgi:hypothetical protein